MKHHKFSNMTVGGKKASFCKVKNVNVKLKTAILLLDICPKGVHLGKKKSPKTILISIHGRQDELIEL